jgi:hypothetical protein
MKRLLIVLAFTLLVGCSSEPAAKETVKDEPKTEYKFSGNVRDDAVKVYDDINNTNTTKEMFDEDYVYAFLDEYSGATGANADLVDALGSMAALAKLTAMGADGEQDTYEKVRAEAWSIISE